MILMIDNYDSFTYNLVQYLAELGADVVVKRNDEVTLKEVITLKPEKIMLSPGPCNPDKAGISLEVVGKLSGKIPLLGICLGHQTIGQSFGGDVVHANKIMHGKTSPIYHNNKGVFKGLNNPLIATRYHSLVVDKKTLPDELRITAWTENKKGEIDEIMGIQHKSFNVEGVQFHPESILTEQGHELLNNFLEV